MSTPVPLIRRFTTIARAPRGDADLDETWLQHGRGERVDWGQLRSQYRAVILADAGAGKTFELKAEAERLLERGRRAFFIRIEDIDAYFGNAFEVGSQEAFEHWLSGTEEAWFFLDSVDEVRLETPRAFEMAMHAFAARIQNARQRAHVIISSRPYAWRSELDGALIDELLPYAPVRAEHRAEVQHSGAKNGSTKQDGALQLYQLAPLDRDQIRLFAAHRDVLHVEGFLDALERHALYGLAQLPFDLEDLIAIWNRTGALYSRLAILEQGLHQRLGTSNAAASVLSLDRALDGARRLALAMTLTGEANIRLPGEAGSGVNASALLFDWSPQEVRELLSRGIFSDAIYSMVRFRHREARELLAAQGLASVLHRPTARTAAEELIFREIYGEHVVVPRLRSVLPWLLLFDEEIRDRALALRPEIAIEGGDPAQLPLATRMQFLRDIVAGIISKKNRGGDNGQIARIAQPDLERAVLELLDSHIEDDDVVFFLGRLAWQGGMRAAAHRLVPVARDPGRGIYARIASVRAVMSVGDADRRIELWAALQASTDPLPHDLLAELADGTPTDIASVERLLVLLKQLEPYARFTVTGLPRAFHGYIDRLPMTGDCAAERPLEHLVMRLTTYLFREPFIHKNSGCRVSQQYSWLMAPALHAVERLIIGRSNASFETPALDILTQALVLRHHGGFEDYDYKTKVGELVPRWIELNDALFWCTVAAARDQHPSQAEPLTDDWTVEWPGHFWHFDGASFTRTLDWVQVRDLPEDRSMALSRSFRTYVQNNRPRVWRDALWRAVRGSPALETKLRLLMRPPPNPDRKQWRADKSQWARRRRVREEEETQARAQFVSRLKADPEVVSIAPGVSPGEMSWDQFHLFNIIHGNGLRFSRGGSGNWEALIPEFGSAVAQAYRDAALRHWRAYKPRLRSEGADGSQIPHSLVFGMAGIEIEAGPDGYGLAVLNEDEARHAIRYALWEINGFPDWLEPLFRSHREASLELVRGEIFWEITTSSPDQPMHYLLHDVVYHAPWLLGDVAAPVRSWLMEHGASNADVLRHARAIMAGGGLAPEVIAELARARAQAGDTAEAQLPTWFAIWVDADPTGSIDALEAKLASLERASATAFAQNFLGALTGDRVGGGAVIGAWRTVGHLRHLYGLMHRHIRVTEDIDRSEGGAYSPTARDDAQRARDHLFSLLADTPGEAAYAAIQELAREHPEIEYRAYMRRAARDRATADSDRTWNEQQVQELFQHLFEPPRAPGLELDMTNTGEPPEPH